MSNPQSIAIIGSGPTALMAADVLSQSIHQVSLFEKRKGLGRKLLIAGSSGLNITNDLPLDEFRKNYTGPADLWERLLADFPPQKWIQFLEDLGSPTFKGTSGRYFVQDMKASGVLKSWKTRLENRGVRFHFDAELTDFHIDPSSNQIKLEFGSGKILEFDAALIALGGASYEPNETPLRWPEIFKRKGLAFVPFTSSNAGINVDWKVEFLKEAEGKPLKNVELITQKGRRRGEIVITRYGMEGTPVYAVGVPGKARLDLKPDLTLDQVFKKCASIKENLSPIRRVKKQLNLSEAALALIFHHAPKHCLADLKSLCQIIKSFPLNLRDKQPLSEAISSAGGLSFSEVNENWMLKSHPGIFVGGEMLDWDAPTGGFLIQACVSQGYSIGNSILKFLPRD